MSELTRSYDKIGHPFQGRCGNRDSEPVLYEILTFVLTSLFRRVNYFDESGVFMAIMFSGPLVLLSVFCLVCPLIP